MDCDELVELVTAFLDGALSVGDEGRFVAHLAECDGCETYLDQFRQTIQTLGRLPAESLSDEARAALLTAFRDWDTDKKA
jgi:anti-sigma factor RsiW